MKLSTFMMPLHPPGRNPAETLAEDREAILLADRLGYAEAFVGEHVTDLAENVTSCLMFLASLAHETKSIVLGSGIPLFAPGLPETRLTLEQSRSWSSGLVQLRYRRSG